MARYELHEWVYQLHNSLDEFKRREYGVYAIVSNGPASTPMDMLGDKSQQRSQEQSQDQQPQGIYAVVRKSDIKPTRQAPPVPPRSKEMNILTDETPPDSVFESNGDRSRELLVSFGSGSDGDFLAQFRKHKRSLSDSLVITKTIDVGSIVGAKPISTVKKSTSATNLTEENLVTKDKGFESPANVAKKKRFNKRRKTIAHTGRRRSRSPPSEPPPPPPSGEKPEVNQAIIDALYALDEELGQNVAVSPKDTMSAVAPIQLEHKTVFATFQSPPGPTSPSTADFDHPQNKVAQQEVSNNNVQQQNGDCQGSDEVDVSHCIKPSAAAGKAKIDQVKGDTPQEVAAKVKKVPPPVKPKPYKPSPPLRTTSYERTAELTGNPVSPSSLKPPTSIKDVKQNKEGTEQKKRSPPRVTFPEELEKAIKRKSLTTFNLDDLNKEAVERGRAKETPMSPNKPKNYSETPMSPNKPKNFSGAGALPKRDNDSSALTTGSSAMNGSTTEESMTKIFQNWPNDSSLSNGSVSDPMSPVNSEPPQWRDSMADQHIYDDPWDKKMKAIMAKSQASMKAGDRNSLERRRTFSNGIQMNGGSRMGLAERSFSIDQQPRNSAIKVPRRGASIEDLYNRAAASAAFTDTFKKGASTENVGSLDPSSPLYVYKKALKNHQQQQQEEEEKERSYTLPLKGSARRRSQQGLMAWQGLMAQQSMTQKSMTQQSMTQQPVAQQSMGQQGLMSQQSAQTSLRPRINNAPGNTPPSRMFTTAQNDNRKFGSVPLQQQQQQPKQYQHMADPQLLQTQLPRRTIATTGNYTKPTNPNYRPHVSNTGSRPIPIAEQNGFNMNRRPMNSNIIFQTPVGMGAEDWRYYQSGTRISYDKNSDTTILRSLV